MTLIKSISGIRGTIGGQPGQNLTPLDVVKFTAAYGTMLLEKRPENLKIVIGRDGRISGKMISDLVVSTLIALGFEVIDLGWSTTPTVEMAVTFENATGGIILTASHNPKEWNALKLLNDKGEFISAEEGSQLLDIAEQEAFNFAKIQKIGSHSLNDQLIHKHIDAILQHPLVDKKAIAARGFKIVVDGVNSTGSIFVPALLKALGVTEILVINEEVTGDFAHNPEPLEENLNELINIVEKKGYDLGIAVDPDVDRLVFVNEDGTLFGEEYTLVAVADYYLSKKKGNTVSNMSSTRALRDITEKHGGEYYPAAVGEVNVVAKMKAVNAVIGGEGNGGIIDPELHYGRDALVGIGLFLSHLAHFGKTISQLRATYPNYIISKNKINLDPSVDVPKIFASIQEQYKNQPINTEDGLKIEFDTDWVHLRTSNTEPIIRIYAESTSETTAENIAKKIMSDIKALL